MTGNNFCIKKYICQCLFIQNYFLFDLYLVNAWNNGVFMTLKTPPLSGELAKYCAC